MSLHISINCFGISVDCFGLSRIKKWMILIITVKLSTGIISVNSVRFSLSAYLRNAKPILSLRRLSRLISLPRKNVKPILVQALHQILAYFSNRLEQFNWLEYDAETKLLFCRT